MSFEENVNRLNCLRLPLWHCFSSSGNNKERKMKNIYCRSGHYGSHAKAMLGGIQTKLTPPVSVKTPPHPPQPTPLEGRGMPALCLQRVEATKINEWGSGYRTLVKHKGRFPESDCHIHYVWAGFIYVHALCTFSCLTKWYKGSVLAQLW